MNTLILKILLIELIFFSSNFFLKNLNISSSHQKAQTLLNISERKFGIKEKNNFIFSQNYCGDSISLKKFWSNFQSDLTKNNKEKIIECFEFPIQAYYFVLFQFSYDCDTIRFIENEKRYYNYEINRNNFKTNYDFIFTEEFKYIINNTSYDSLIKNAIISKDGKSLIYSFFSYNYYSNLNCFSDHCLYLYINQDFGKWTIKVGGV